MDAPAPLLFGTLLRHYRVAAGLTQEALAERARLSVQAIGALERGARRAPYRDTVELLANALALPPEERARLQASVTRQRGPTAQPPAPSAPSTVPLPVPTNVPAPATGFIGREAEQATVVQLLESARLLTLLGTGGIGKTRLATHVAAGLTGRFPDGVRLVELAPLADPGVVPQAVAQAVAQALGIHEQPGRPVLETLVASLCERELLLLLDNCEHVRAAVADLAQALLRACPRLRLLATSREALGVLHETVWRVPPLSLPESAAPHAGGTPRYTAVEVLRAESAQLFCARAAAAHTAFGLTDDNAAAVAAICRRLDGVPLAVELAAARVRILDPAQIAARLDERFRLLAGGRPEAPSQQQTLRAAFDWSYDLLSRPERALLERLSIFDGGCDIDAAEAVCADKEIQRDELFELLASLVEKSLVVVEHHGVSARYRMLEVVRAHALERLAAAGGLAAARERHRTYFTWLAEREEGRLVGPGQPAATARLESEIDNLRAALTEAERSGSIDQAAHLAARLWRFWFVSGRVTEGRNRIAAVLEAGAALPPALRAPLLDAAGTLAHVQGAYADAQRAHEESLGIWRDLGDPAGIAGAVGSLGLALKARGDLDGAARCLQEGLSLWRAAGQDGRAAMLLNNLAAVAMDQGDFERADRYQEESLALKRRTGDQTGVATSLHNLADSARSRGQYERAAILSEESLTTFRGLGLKPHVAQSLHTAGLIATRRGDLPRAAALLGESLTLFRDLDLRWGAPLCLEALAEVAAARGDHRAAARLLGAAEAIRQEIGAPLPPADHPNHDATLTAIRAALPDETFAAVWALGRALTLQQAWAVGLEAASLLAASGPAPLVS